MDNSQDVVEIDLMQMAYAVWRRIWIVILAAFLAGGSAFAGTYYLIDPLYESSVLLYVNNSSFSLGSSSFSISSSELSAAKTLVSTYIVILQTRTTLEDVKDFAKVNYKYEELKKMITASAVNSTEVFEVKATSTDPVEAERIANAIGKILPGKIANIVDGSSVRIVDYAVVPSVRSSPSYSKNTLIGVLLGLILSVGFIVLREMFDIFVRSEQHLTQEFTIPILAVIPDMSHTESGGNYRSETGYYITAKGGK